MAAPWQGRGKSVIFFEPLKGVSKDGAPKRGPIFYRAFPASYIKCRLLFLFFYLLLIMSRQFQYGLKVLSFRERLIFFEIFGR